MVDIIITSNAGHLAKNLSKYAEFNINYLRKNKDGLKDFPDGEVYVNLGELSAERTVVLHSGAPDPNTGLVELEFVLCLLKSRKIRRIELFLAYFPYCRQDSVFEEGEINAAESLVARWVDFYGIKKIFVIDPHFEGRDWLIKYPVFQVSGISAVIQAASKKYPDILLVAPDEGSAKRNKLRGFCKERKNSYDVEVSCPEDLAKSINGRIVGVIDDMIGTGGTMVKACKKCKELGAKKVVALATHGVLDDGVARVSDTYDDMFLSNSIRNNCANVDISETISFLLR